MSMQHRVLAWALAIVVTLPTSVSAVEATNLLGTSATAVEGAPTFGGLADRSTAPAERSGIRGLLDRTVLDTRWRDRYLWVGQTIGSAVGTVAAVALCATVGLPAASMAGIAVGVAGSTAGSFIGAWLDDRNGSDSTNPAASSRPPFSTREGLWLQNVGPCEQAAYQTDVYGLSGSTVAGLVAYGVAGFTGVLADRLLPGSSPVIRTVTQSAIGATIGAVGGTLFDHADSAVDLGTSVGRPLDRWLGTVDGPVTGP